MRTIDTLLRSYPAGVRALALDARRLIRRLLPGVRESVDTSAPVIGYGFGSGYRGVVCTLILSQSGVKLGIVRGAELEDPRGLLRGAGKVHRHVQLHAPADLRQAGLNPLIKAAQAAWRKRNAAPRQTTR